MHEAMRHVPDLGLVPLDEAAQRLRLDALQHLPEEGGGADLLRFGGGGGRAGESKRLFGVGQFAFENRYPVGLPPNVPDWRTLGAPKLSRRDEP